MSTYFVGQSKAKISLDAKNFKAMGGEGAVHVVGDYAYKICNPNCMIPEKKIQELSEIQADDILVPLEVIYDKKGYAVGYTMKRASGNAFPLAQIMSKSYRERENIKHDKVAEIVKKIAFGIRSIHKKNGYLQVDGNEYNYMLNDEYDKVYFIDTNSYQTPSFPATAIMPSIRDYHVKMDSNNNFLWTHNSDWFSFAIISFYLFTGIHPFKGRHPNFKNLKTMMQDQMLASKSVLDSETSYPKAAVYSPFEQYIPGGKNGKLMKWYEELFVKNNRSEPPFQFEASKIDAPKYVKIVGTQNFNINLINEFDDAIIGHYFWNNTQVIVTKKSVYINNQLHQYPSDRFKIFWSQSSCPVAAWINESQQLCLYDFWNKKQTVTNVQSRKIMPYKGSLYVLRADDVCELNYNYKDGNTFITTRTAANISSESAEMHQGVVFQRFFNEVFVSVFPEKNFHYSLKIPELNSLKIIEAKFEKNVLMVCGMDISTKEQKQALIKFNKSYNDYEVTVSETDRPNINFVCLDNNICVYIDGEENVLIFNGSKEISGVKSISDNAISSDMHVCHENIKVKIAKDNKFYDFSKK